MKKIPLRNKKGVVVDYALVDDDKYDMLMQYKWSTIKNQSGNIYARRAFRLGGKVCGETMHRKIMNQKDPKVQIDHIDHNGLNNQCSNLRIATHSQNQMNKRGHGKSKYLGVCWATIKNKHINKFGEEKIYISGAWKASIKYGGKYYNLGYFKTEEEAARAYDEVAIRELGEWANPNFK